MAIKSIVFDLGNVIIDLDYPRHFEAMKDIFGDRWDGESYPESVEDVLIRYEKGLISDDAFIWAFQQIKPDMNPRTFMLAWNSMLGEIRAERFDMLEDLKERYKLYLLSNTNNMHLMAERSYLRKDLGRTDFESRYFRDVFYSHEIKMRKPDGEIYRYVQTMIGDDASEILFIDDRIENVEGARAEGWCAVLHTPSEDITANIEGYIASANS